MRQLKREIGRRLDTKSRSLTAAQGLLQSYGYNGFSFQHIADIVGVQKPSLYEHFRSKEELGKALIIDYQERFEKWTESATRLAPEEQISAFFGIFYSFAKDQRKCCPLTALTAEYNSLPRSLLLPLRKLQMTQLKWLELVVASGKKTKRFHMKLGASEVARLLVSLSYGAQLSARISRDPRAILEARNHALNLLGARPRKFSKTEISAAEHI